MEKPKPIKRSPELAPLSREHHEGLLLVWKIRQGLRMSLPALRIGSYVDWFWQHYLQPHFRMEEESLLPLLPPGDPQALQLEEEHQELEALLHINASIPDAALLEELAEKLNAHIRFEERQLFPRIEQLATPGQLSDIHHLLTKQPSVQKTWDDPFWLPQKPSSNT
jgi:hypothetical protein